MKRTLRGRLSRHAVDTIITLLMCRVAFEGFAELPALLLAVKLNVFVLPVVAVTDTFDFPIWVWYIVSLLWTAQIIYYLDIDAKDALYRVNCLFPINNGQTESVTGLRDE